MSDDLINAAELGEEARNFIGSQLGQKILDLANDDVEQALHALSEVDPTDEKKIRDLQMDARFGRTFAQRLMNLIHEGEQAMEVFKQQREAA